MNIEQANCYESCAVRKLHTAYIPSVISVVPVPCLDNCFCSFSEDDETNTLNCSHNNMTQLPSEVVPGTELLIMTGNDINKLESVDTSPVKIIKFDLQESNIHHIGDKAMKNLLSGTDSLKLSKNRIKQLPSFLSIAKYKTKLWLSDNPYECNCDMLWMKDWLLNASNVMDAENITCGSEHWKGTYSWTQLIKTLQQDFHKFVKSISFQELQF